MSTSDGAAQHQAEPTSDSRTGAAARSRAPGFDALLTATFALAGFGFGIQRLFDNSFLWHLRTGELILDAGRIPTTDPYSFTAGGTEWVVQSWFAEVTYAGLDRLAGPLGIRLLVAATGACFAVLLFRMALRLSRETWRAAGLTLAAVLAVHQLWTARPLAFGLLAFAVLAWIVEAQDSWSGRRAVWLLPLLFWFWVNVHGSFALGFLYVTLHLAGRWWEGERPWEGRQRRILYGTALSGLAVFLTPLGYKLAFFPLRVVDRGDMFRRVVEWASPNFREPVGIFLALWLVVLLIAVSRGSNRPTRRDVMVLLPFVLLALWAQRNIAVLPIVTLPIAARCMSVAPGGSRRSEPSPIAAWGFLVVLIGTFAALTATAIAEDDFALDRHPEQALAFLDDSDLLGERLLTTDAWGGFVIYRYWPDQEVFIDDRIDMYPRDVLDDYLEVATVGEKWAEVLDQREVEIVVWPRGRALGQVLDADPGWIELYRDDQAVVYGRDQAAGP